MKSPPDKTQLAIRHVLHRCSLGQHTRRTGFSVGRIQWRVQQRAFKDGREHIGSQGWEDEGYTAVVPELATSVGVASDRHGHCFRPPQKHSVASTSWERKARERRRPFRCILQGYSRLISLFSTRGLCSSCTSVRRGVGVCAVYPMQRSCVPGF